VEKLIVIVFDDQTKADAGFEILRLLDRDGDISVYEAQTIAKEPSGGIQYIDNSDKLAFPVIGGATAVGALVGLLGGPLGALIGGMAGGLIGSIGDLEHAGVTDEFVDDVNTVMTAGKFAVVADVSEDWVTPLAWSSGELAVRLSACITTATWPHIAPKWSNSRPNGRRRGPTAWLRSTPRSTP
jgi:uncharacterized membrane protein